MHAGATEEDPCRHGAADPAVADRDAGVVQGAVLRRLFPQLRPGSQQGQRCRTVKPRASSRSAKPWFEHLYQIAAPVAYTASRTTLVCRVPASVTLAGCHPIHVRKCADWELCHITQHESQGPGQRQNSSQVMFKRNIMIPASVVESRAARRFAHRLDSKQQQLELGAEPERHVGQHRQRDRRCQRGRRRGAAEHGDGSVGAPPRGAAGEAGRCLR